MKNKLFILLAILVMGAGCKKSVLNRINEINNVEEQTKVDFTYTTDGLAVQFTNTSQSKTYTFYAWDFGDGKSVTSVWSPKHTYDKAGTYNVSLWVKWIQDGAEMSKTCTKTITITNPQPQYSNIYIKGFRYEKIPENAYYRTTCECLSLFGNTETISVSEKYISSGTLPYTITLDTPRKLGDSHAFDWIDNITVSATNSVWRISYTQVIRQSVSGSVLANSLPLEYTFTSNNGQTQIVILFDYK